MVSFSSYPSLLSPEIQSSPLRRHPEVDLLERPGRFPVANLRGRVAEEAPRGRERVGAPVDVVRARLALAKWPKGPEDHGCAASHAGQRARSSSQVKTPSTSGNVKPVNPPLVVSYCHPIGVAAPVASLTSYTPMPPPCTRRWATIDFFQPTGFSGSCIISATSRSPGMREPFRDAPRRSLNFAL